MPNEDILHFLAIAFEGPLALAQQFHCIFLGKS